MSSKQFSTIRESLCFVENFAIPKAKKNSYAIYLVTSFSSCLLLFNISGRHSSAFSSLCLSCILFVISLLSRLLFNSFSLLRTMSILITETAKSYWRTRVLSLFCSLRVLSSVAVRDTRALKPVVVLLKAISRHNEPPFSADLRIYFSASDRLFFSTSFGISGC